MEYIRTELKKPLIIEGIYTIHYFEYTKDFAYSGEFHDFWEIVYADKKSVVITAGAQELTLTAGQMYIHKPNEFHKIRCDGTQAANSVILSFDCPCPELMSIAGVVINCTSEERRLMGLIISEAEDAFSTPLGTSYTRVLEKSETGNFGCEQMIQLYMEQLLIRLIRGNKQSVTPKAMPATLSCLKSANTSNKTSANAFLFPIFKRNSIFRHPLSKGCSETI